MENTMIMDMVSKGKVASQAFEQFNQAQVDAIVRAIAKVVYDNAEPLARMAVEETRMGVYEDKIKKNQGKARIIWNSLKTKKTVGVIDVNPETGVTMVARPMGVVGAISPCTNPIVTPMCNAMFALKARNAIIIAPHPRAKKCAVHVVGMFNEELAKLGAPQNLIQVIAEPSVESSSELMRCADVVVATGGMAMVKAAYSSGKPAYGVGVGNVQCIVDRGMNLEEVVPKIVAGRVFDNGIICSAEQTIIVHQEDYDNLVAELKKNDVFYIDNAQDAQKLRETLFPDGIMNKDLVGQSALKVAELSGLTLPSSTKVIGVLAKDYGKNDLFSKEKMCPVFSIYRYDAFEKAIEIANANLAVDGKGHSVSIHSNNRQHVEWVANSVPVSRVLVNQVCATMNGGSFYNGFAATTTLGCGSWGGNSISENLDVKHLMNVTRIGEYMANAYVPSDDEIWG